MLQIIPATCALSAQTRTLICSKGICAPPAIALAAMIAPPSKPLKAGVNAFIIDSGSGQHLIRRSMVASEEHITYCEEGLLLQTANGIVKSHLKTRVNIKRLGIKVDAWILDNTPLVLSTGKLIEENGCDFQWDHRTKKATLSKDRQKFNLIIQRGVRLLPVR